MRDARRLDSTVRFVYELGQLVGKYGSIPPPNWTSFGQSSESLASISSEEQLTALEAVAAEKIESAARSHAQSNPLLQLESRQLRLLLACWNAWGGEEPVRKWGKRMGLPALLAAFLEEGGIRLPPPGASAVALEPFPPRIDPECLLFFFPDLSELERAALALDDRVLTDKQKTARNALLAGLREWKERKKKEDPFRIFNR